MVLKQTSNAFIRDNLAEKLPKKNLVKSPISYPGGKSRAVRIINKFIPDGTEKIISPFFGGGKLELVWDSMGIKVIGYDLFDPVVDFWQIAIEDAKGMSIMAEQFVGHSKAYFKTLQNTYFKHQFASALQFFILNKSSFSGLTFSGGMSLSNPISQRNVEVLSEFSVNKLEVHLGHFRDTIASNTDSTLMYLDPPYYLVDKSLCYGVNGDLQRNFPHDDLRAILGSKDNWILSYNNRPEVREWYKDYLMLEAEWSYGMVSTGNYKTETELLIFSHDLGGLVEFEV